MKDIRIVEIGDRVAAAACGSLLAALGAEVVLVEPPESRRDHKWANRAVVAAGKKSLRASLQDPGVAALLAEADVVIASTDLAPIPAYARSAAQIVCDITAYGSSGPQARVPHADVLIQAVSGLIDTTGDPEHPPLPIGVPIAECIGALYAAAGIAAALRARDRTGKGQDVEIALYDCAFSTLTTFLSFYFAGKSMSRSGNRHVLAAPWNCYQARDGWIVICTATDDQWKRLCTAIERPEFAADPKFIDIRARLVHRAAVDAAVQQWVGSRTLAQCFERLHSCEIACGPVVPVGELSSEPNLRHRRALVYSHDPLSNKQVLVPGEIVKRSGSAPSAPPAIPRPDEDRAKLAASPHRPAPRAADSSAPPRPALAGVKVLEIGQFTTAPLVSRQLAALGAEVLKIEPPAGDPSRGWDPGQFGQSYFFSTSNSGKRSASLNLRDAEDRERFLALVAESDVLLENLKPGSLQHLGLGMDTLTRINPRLIYCAISGFGADSAYPGRAAFDTVAQAMSGLMDLTRQEGVPQKPGISSADILGGLFGLVAVLDALAAPESERRAQAIDISMQDASAWLTLWPQGYPAGAHVAVIPCSDGYAAAILNTSANTEANAQQNELLSSSRKHSRDELVQRLAKSGIAAAPILTVNEAAAGEQTQACGLLARALDGLGREWPMIPSPIRLSGAPVIISHAIGPLGEANAQLVARLRPK